MTHQKACFSNFQLPLFFFDTFDIFKIKKEAEEEQSMYLVSTIAGGEKGYQDRKGKEAKFNFPGGICVDDRKNVFVADYWNHCIRLISPDGMVSTLAGRPGIKGEVQSFYILFLFLFL